MDPRVRMSLLQPNMTTAQRVVHINFPVTIACPPHSRLPAHGRGRRFSIVVSPDLALRPQRLVTDVRKLRQAYIDRIQVGNVLVPYLSMSIDAYYWSATYAQRLRNRFLREHGLLKSTREEITAFCEDHGVWPQDPCRVTMNTMSPGTQVRIEGAFLVSVRELPRFAVVLYGLGLE